MCAGKLVFVVDICVEPDDDGYHAFSPALKGLHSWGGTEAEAVENAKDAALAYIESLIKHQEPIPVGVLAAPQAGRKRVSICPKQIEATLSLAAV
jgi:predicted RNase H-like HicB family nuclease